MQDTFQCTPELLCEFFDSLPRGSSVGDIFYYWDKFKSSKSPKKEWEIVAYKFKPLSEEKPVLVMPNSQYWKYAETGDPEYSIHSVRRLSDGEVFTKNEVVQTPKDGQHHIGGFEIVGNDLIANFSTGKLLLKHLQKLPQKVFTTIDGADIYEDGNFWHVNEDWTLSNFGVSTEWIDYSKPYKDFSTRQAAEEYILNNRPLLSLSDVKKVFGEHEVYLLPTELEEKLTALVKQKLNQ